MKTIIVLRDTITIVLIALTVTESLRIPAYDRVDEFMDLQGLKYNLIMTYLPNSDVEKTLDLLSQFVLDESELNEFVRHLQQTGEPAQWMMDKKLKNPKLYELLRFEISTELIPLNRNTAMERIVNLKINAFANSPKVHFHQIWDAYVNEKLNELISLEDYYAIRILLKDHSQINVENPVGWRIRRAIYSLAIRQYSLNFNHDRPLAYCFQRKIISKSDVNQFKKNEILQFDEFLICRNKQVFSGSNINPYVIHQDDFLAYIDILNTDSRLMVSLDEIIKFEDDIIFFALFPKTSFKVDDAKFFTTSGGLTSYLSFKTMPTTISNSQLLAFMANSIEEYKEKEEEYYNNVPSSSSSDESH